MGYAIEQKPCSKAGWFTPDEARRFYGKYARDGVTVHWWGDGTGEGNHDNIVRYLNGRGAAGQAPTANYVLSDAKITECVAPENVAWTSGTGNPTTIGVETEPQLSDEGYKKWGFLLMTLERRFGKTLKLYPHNYWNATQCPGSISLDRIRQEANKWHAGQYDPAPPTPTPPATANLEWIKLPKVEKYLTNKNPTKLWNFNQTSWGGFGTGVKDFAGGSEIEIYGKVINHTLNATYLVTEYSFSKKITNGFNEKDMSLKLQPVPTPDPIPAPIPVPNPDPEWVKNLKDIDNTKMWIKNDCALVNIATGATVKEFKKDEVYEVSALTTSGGKEYRLTEYSFQKKIYNGVDINNLTLTAPGVPDVPPVPQPPTPTPPDTNAIIAFLQLIGKMIAEFIEKLKPKN